MLTWLYRCFARHRYLLALLYALFVVGGCWCFTAVDQREDALALLPDNAASELRRQFSWLQRAPFARKILIDLYAEDGVSAAHLRQATVQLAERLQPPLFDNVMYAPVRQFSGDFRTRLLQALPALFSAADMRALEQRLAADNIRHQLGHWRDMLYGSEQWLAKEQLRHDPLQLWQIAAAHLRAVNPMRHADSAQREFVSADGRHRLIIAATNVGVSDIDGGRRLLARLNAASAALPAGITATVVCGHRYTLANVTTIKHDMTLVLGCATIAILLIFLLWLRSPLALLVFALPASVLGYAVAAVALCFPAVSGITIGFGAVLLGISVDYTIHVYLAMRYSARAQRLQRLRSVAVPLGYGALTSIAAFAVLLTSTLPEQRQLAVFSIVALTLALLLALVVMPHWCGGGGATEKPDAPTPAGRYPLLLWLVVMVVCAVALPRVRFNGDMHSLSAVPPAVHAAEKLIKRTWGDMRTSAMIFARGNSLEQALTVNDAIYRLCRQHRHAAGLVSLAALLPAAQTQRDNMRRWRNFWVDHAPQLQRNLEQAAAQYSFNAGAFTPFWRYLNRKPRLIDLDWWRQLGLTTITADLTVRGDAGEYAVITMLDETALDSDLRRDLEQIPAALVVAPGQFSRTLSHELAGDMRAFILRALAAVVLLLALLYRNLRLMALALLPVGGGLLFMFGVMGWLGQPFNLFNIIAAILIIGLGVDYGIFIVASCRHGAACSSRRAVLVSALTTLAGFGSLVLADHPAMYSIGLSVLLGIAAAVVTALYVVPCCWRLCMADRQEG